MFWEIIEKADAENIRDEIFEALVQLKEEDIVDFEKILRQKIIELDDFKVMATLNIVEGYVSDDSYIYFRAWLISKGKAACEMALKDPNQLASIIDTNEAPEFEELLYLADEAFEKITGKEEDDSFPRNVCLDLGLDYDFNCPPTKGEEYDEDDLKELYPDLWWKYN